ncbi:hypothetical protein D6851_13415 [Altericroceibacterium spongiae]|uniref:Uncharacterized protein n=1 Tax=Altericroceibacterium spongiae TaxID=2320269 RepID=A0A420EEA4_9SPHN|nr:hypothetical protein D6851_13415 [Altericroceibacterium spongiae]
MLSLAQSRIIKIMHTHMFCRSLSSSYNYFDRDIAKLNLRPEGLGAGMQRVLDLEGGSRSCRPFFMQIRELLQEILLIAIALQMQVCESSYDSDASFSYLFVTH